MPKKKVTRGVKDPAGRKPDQSRGSVFRNGRSNMQIVDDMAGIEREHKKPKRK